MLISVTLRSAGIPGLNPAKAMDILLLCLMCGVQADASGER